MDKIRTEYKITTVLKDYFICSLRRLFKFWLPGSISATPGALSGIVGVISRSLKIIHFLNPIVILIFRHVHCKCYKNVSVDNYNKIQARKL